MSMVPKDLADALVEATTGPGSGLAHAALLIARIEYPHLDPEPYLEKLDAMGEGARQAMERRASCSDDRSPAACVQALNEYLFDVQGFEGNRQRYEDPRNSCLNEVLERRTGIPITLSVVYMEVAQRAGLRIEGVNFPGHFLVRCKGAAERASAGLIIDPFHRGAVLTEHDCRVLLQRHVGPEVAFSRSLLSSATRAQVIARMLLNLKRLYVHMRSFPQARDVTDLILAITPSALTELRDRGLLAYHLNDVTSALRDLQTYLKLARMSQMDDDAKDEHEQIWEHVKALRRRVAALN
jgi:regulator of sirC expression with transglutaminase-like and TPR domain